LTLKSLEGLEYSEVETGNQHVFKIGDFAVIAQIPASQLRYYDDIGLFKPCYIDGQNGYRYYRLEQLADLNRILALKNLGLSLDEVRNMLETHISNHDIRLMLEAKKKEIEQRIADERIRLQHVEARLQLLEKGYTPATQPIVVKPVASQSYLALERISTNQEEFITRFSNDYNAVHRVEIRGRSYAVCVAYNMGYQLHGLRWQLGFYLQKSIQKEEQTASATAITVDNLHLQHFTLPAVENMASIIHVGTLETGSVSYAALMQWITFNNYTICGAFREVFLVASAPLDITASIVMEIQVPVQHTGD
jgi:DNA-binding transcriptional MerR regulator